ncbi:COQ9 family protein [Paremcibacter congregatus]|uniref:COQ9 family protein n=1 Tax=Paremcibacter congregatus TaxID=2043170 RepID=A0A2G4YRE6_9PROT|nr:COQ9 family protein [Paremcibacter congregatus]PHZ84909.1 COQ9 family protein [Paremcibacter congregatus]QDE26117.1 COQ9 family protein [Paremcibacter congregatus]
MTKKPSDIPDDWRAPLLVAALPHVPFDGWSDQTLTRAAEEIGLNPGIAKLAFPSGAIDMIDLMAQQRDQMMVEACPPEKLAQMKIREKITFLVRTRIEAEDPLRDAARAAVAYLALPTHSAQGLKMMYRTVDLMWKTTGDPSTDFNYYTKRLTLSGVYSTTLLYWLNDDSADRQDTWAFLDRRIENVIQFEKGKARARKLSERLPDITSSFWKNVSRLRYPAR